jgi:hypothetical protein
MLEIYNENVVDLLSTTPSDGSRPSLEIRQVRRACFLVPSFLWYRRRRGRLWLVSSQRLMLSTACRDLMVSASLTLLARRLAASTTSRL